MDRASADRGNHLRLVDFSVDDAIFFHSFDGQVVCDEEGVELPGTDAAVARATHEVRILAAESILASGTLPLNERIEVTDGNGGAVATVSVRDAVAITDP